MDENISISDFSKGFYIIKIVTNQGKIEKKILKI
jgi:hypothetical protein